MKKTLVLLAALAAMTAASNAQISGEVAITEYAYQGNGGEFFEITNISDSSVDLTGWSYDDDSRTAGTVSLSSLGTLAPGQSAIVTELAASTFVTEWSVSGHDLSTTKILGNNIVNLGRADEINIYNASSVLVARLTYNDQNVPPFGPRTNNDSGVTIKTNWANENETGKNTAVGWFLSGSASDTFGITWTSASGSKGSPGVVQP